MLKVHHVLNIHRLYEQNAYSICAKCLCALQVGYDWPGTYVPVHDLLKVHLEYVWKTVLTFFKNPNCSQTLIQHRTVITISPQSPKYCF